MPIKAVLSLLVLPGALLAGASRRVEVVSTVPLVSQVDHPGEVQLAPGESREVTVRVACNQPWLITVQVDNPSISSSGRQIGSAGGMSASGHTFAVTLSCAADAAGPQHATFVTQLISGPLVAGLPR